MPTPPEVPVVVGATVVPVWGEPPPGEGIPVPPVLALAIAGAARANAAKLGRIRWVTRKVSFVGLRG
jgi:hypothetical protein